MIVASFVHYSKPFYLGVTPLPKSEVLLVILLQYSLNLNHLLFLKLLTLVDKKSEASNLNLLPCTCIKMELLLLQSAIEGKEVTNELFLQEVVDHINNFIS